MVKETTHTKEREKYLKKLDISKTLPAQVAIEMHKNANSPRYQIVICHSMLESMVNCLIETYCKNADSILEDNRGYSHGVKLLLLNKLKIIDDTNYAVLNWFRKLRNKVVHKPNYNIDWDYIKQTKWKDIKESKTMFDICMCVFAVLWNQNKDVFTKKFVP